MKIWEIRKIKIRRVVQKVKEGKDGGITDNKNGGDWTREGM